MSTFDSNMRSPRTRACTLASAHSHTQSVTASYGEQMAQSYFHKGSQWVSEISTPADWERFSEAQAGILVTEDVWGRSRSL